MRDARRVRHMGARQEMAVAPWAPLLKGKLKAERGRGLGGRQAQGKACLQVYIRGKRALQQEPNALAQAVPQPARQRFLPGRIIPGGSEHPVRAFRTGILPAWSRVLQVKPEGDVRLKAVNIEIVPSRKATGCRQRRRVGDRGVAHDRV
jgi:hypothetical protein